MATILDVLQTESFIEAVFLLLIAAIVTDLLVPRVKTRLDQDKFERQKRFEDELARAAKLREDRINLLDELEALLWDYQFLLLEPSYFVLRSNSDGFKIAFQRYDEKAPLLLSSIRTRISKLNRLGQPQTHQKLRSLFKRLIQLDSDLIRLEKSNDMESKEWNQHHNQDSYRLLSEEIEASLLLIAQDFGLTQSQAILERRKI